MTDVINVGTTDNDGTGDTLRAAFTQINERFNTIAGALTGGDAWAAGVTYAATPVRNWVVESGNAYVCAVNHVSGATFAGDFAGGKWLAVDTAQLSADLASSSGAGMVGFSPTGTISSTTVQAAIAELSTELATSDASGITYTPAGTGAVATTVQGKLRESVSVTGFGAVGNADAAGTVGTNDSAAFALLESSFTGIAVDLNGKIYLVDSPIPHANQYFNGSFVVAAATTDDQPVLAAFGRNSLSSNTFIPRQFSSSTLTWAAGNYNTAYGADTMVNNTTGRRNTAIGANAFNQNSSGFYNTVVGAWASYSNTIGNYNTVVGNQSLQFNTIGNNNTVVGEGSLVASVSGSNNVVVGDTAAVAVASGNRNIAIGSQALKTTTALLNDTIAIGYQALSFSVTGSLNLAIGNYTLGSNTSGSNNISIGHQSLANNSTASDNIAVGVQALNACTDSPKNVAIGKSALSSITTGTLQNTAVGHNALAALTTGGNNTAIGASAGSGITVYDNTTSVGYNAQPTASNEVKLGNSSVQTINLGNELKIDIASILAAPAGTPIVVRVSGGVKYISV